MREMLPRKPGSITVFVDSCYPFFDMSWSCVIGPPMSIFLMHLLTHSLVPSLPSGSLSSRSARNLDERAECMSSVQPGAPPLGLRKVQTFEEGAKVSQAGLQPQTPNSMKVSSFVGLPPNHWWRASGQARARTQIQASSAYLSRVCLLPVLYTLYIVRT